MKQTAVFDILQLGLIRIINCCSFASGMKCAEPKPSGFGAGAAGAALVAELEAAEATSSSTSWQGEPLSLWGAALCSLAALARLATSTHLSQAHPPGAILLPRPGLQLHGLTHTSLHPGSPQVPALPRCQQQQLSLLEGPP